MGANQTNNGLLAFLALYSGAESLAWTGFRGHGEQREHRMGSVAIDTIGLLRLRALTRRTSLHEASVATGVESWLGLGVKPALLSLPVSMRVGAAAWRAFETPERVVGIAVEASPDGPIALPLIGGPGEHYCGAAQPLASDLSAAPWAGWIRENGQDAAMFARLVSAIVSELHLG